MDPALGRARQLHWDEGSGSGCACEAHGDPNEQAEILLPQNALAFLPAFPAWQK